MLTKWRTCKEKEDVTLESRKKVEWVGLGLNHVQLCMLLSFQYHPICTQFARLDVHLPLFVCDGARIILIQPVDLTDIETWGQAYKSRKSAWEPIFLPAGVGESRHFVRIRWGALNHF